MTDDVARETMKRVANDYDRLADHAEHAAKPQSDHSSEQAFFSASARGEPLSQTGRHG